ncbi:tetratricopeptide repeat protein, partial [Bradyrhizobium sp. Arg68]|nr:tetratricopeptide repeat protein [Bradyrhizobium ivorense]
LLRAQRAADAAKKKPPMRVRALVQPTFVRFVFEVPDGVGVSSVLNEQKLTLSFNTVLSFDLADAKVAAPPNVASISARADADTSAVDMTLIGDADVHSFRDEKNYIVDVAIQQNEQQSTTKGAISSLMPMPRGKQKGMPAAAVPVTSENIAREAKIEIKPEPAKAEPQSEAAKPELAKPEPAKPEQGSAEPPTAAPSKSEQPKSEQPRSELPKMAAAPAEKAPAAESVPMPAAPREGSAGTAVEETKAAVSETMKPPSPVAEAP